MHFTRNLGNIEFPPVKRTTGNFEMKVRIFFMLEGNDAMYVSCWRAAELVGFNHAVHMRSDGTRNQLCIGDAKSIGEVKFFCCEIRAQSVGAEMLRAMAQAAVGQQQESIG